MRNRPSIALLPGWATSSKLWRSTKQAITQRGFDAAIFEYSGYGLRENDKADASFELLVDDASKQLQDYSIWVGWSLGALVALAAASRSHTALKGVVAVCGTAKFCFNDDRVHALSKLKQEVATDHVKSVKWFLKSMPSVEHRRKIFKQLPLDDSVATKETLLSGLEILSRADLGDEVNKICVPVKIISGKDDQIIPASAGMDLHRRIPQSTFTALPCGHIPFLECPELFTEQLFEFIETIIQSHPD